MTTGNVGVEMTAVGEWTHPSIRQMLDESGARDPFLEIADRARAVALDALQDGWKGPPFDPFELASRMGIATVPREDLEDARLVSARRGRRQIEFNPHRRASRVRFSVAHELGHTLFADHGNQVRYRNESHASADRRPDSWQLEVLCNVAAAELLMPAGAFPPEEAEDLRLARLLDLRPAFGVSTEALLRRVMHLTGRSAQMFACTRRSDGQFRVDYSTPSRAWEKPPGQALAPPLDTALAHCTAVGFSIDEHEHWSGLDDVLRVQAIGTPPFPGDRYPRVIGLLTPPAEDDRRVTGVHIVRGDATRPVQQGPTIIAHVVNNRARRWGGRSFASALGVALPAANEHYAQWAAERNNLRLAEVHIDEAAPGLWVASMVAQAGYGESARPRLRLPALAHCLRTVAGYARELGASVHMPPIGTGNGGTPWPPVRDLILEELVNQDVPVTVYVLEDSPMPEEALPQLQLALG